MERDPLLRGTSLLPNSAAARSASPGLSVREGDPASRLTGRRVVSEEPILLVREPMVEGNFSALTIKTATSHAAPNNSTEVS